MKKTKLSWNELDKKGRKELLRLNAMRLHLKNKSWNELDNFIKYLLQDYLESRSDNKLTINK